MDSFNSIRVNPKATLTLCDRCHEHTPAMRLRAWNPETGQDEYLALCWGCAVAADQTALLWPMGEQIRDELDAWMHRERPMCDCDDATFYSRLDTGRPWGQRELDLEAERLARRAYIASCMEGVAA